MAELRYKITGQHDSKGIKDAQSGIASLKGALEGLKSVAGPLIAIASMAKLKDTIVDATNAFKVQQNALTAFTQAAKNNANITDQSFKNIIAYTSELQSKSVFGDEVLQQQAAYLTNLGLTEKQIKDTLKAAVELSSAGIGTLESNVKNLGKTFNGMAGELGKVLPGIKNLTKEQLAHGDAIKYVNEQYKGFAESKAGTFDGLQTQIQNLVGDIKEKFGAIFAGVSTALFQKLKPILESVNNWLSKNMIYIVNAFIRLPEVAAVSFGAIKNIIVKTFSFEMIFKSLGNGLNLSFKAITLFLQAVWDVIVALGQTIWQPLLWGFQNMVYGVGEFFVGMINFIIGGIKAAAEIMNKYLGTKFDVSGFKELKNSMAKPELNTAKISDAWDKLGKNLSNNLKSVGETIVKQDRDLLGSFSGIVSSSIDEIKKIAKSDIPKWLSDAFASVTGNLDLAKESVPSQQKEQQHTTFVGSDEFHIFTSKIGGFADIINSVISGLGGFVETIMSTISSVAIVQKLMNPMQTILEGVIEVAEPILNTLLAPLVGILKIIGRTLALVMMPATLALAPVIDLVGKAFVWLYNYAILPLGNAVIWIVSTMYNLIATMVNAVLNALDKIPFVDIGWRMSAINYDAVKLNPISEADLVASGSTNSTSTSSAYSPSASYTGAKDVTINIHFDHSFVNGDAREIAIALKKEIQLAEALGY